MNQTYDVIIAGLGAMGSAVAQHAAARGLRVLGIDRYAPPHTQGSSHGNTRLIREAYYEHPMYVPLVRRAYDLWRDLEAASGRQLLTRTGSLMIGEPDSGLVAGTRRSAAAHAVPHEVMSAEEVHRHFPGFEVPEGFLGVHEPGSSLLHPESVVSAQLEAAIRESADIRFDCRVNAWRCSETGVEVALDTGSATAGQLVLSAGAWNPELDPGLRKVLLVERQLQQWWRPARSPEWFASAAMPVSMWQLPDSRIFYTMPDTGRGLKLGWHHNGATVDPETVDRQPAPGENAELADLLRRFLPAAKGERLTSAVCFYTNTPDGHFLIDRHPADDRVWIMSPCSGHGFKFASALGDVMAGLLAGEASPWDLTPFQLGRFPT